MTSHLPKLSAGRPFICYISPIFRRPFRRSPEDCEFLGMRASSVVDSFLFMYLNGIASIYQQRTRKLLSELEAGRTTFSLPIMKGVFAVRV